MLLARSQVCLSECVYLNEHVCMCVVTYAHMCLFSHAHVSVLVLLLFCLSLSLSHAHTHTGTIPFSVVVGSKALVPPTTLYYATNTLIFFINQRVSTTTATAQ